MWNVFPFNNPIQDSEFRVDWLKQSGAVLSAKAHPLSLNAPYIV
jgi:hypothetical protein